MVAWFTILGAKVFVDGLGCADQGRSAEECGLGLLNTVFFIGAIVWPIVLACAYDRTEPR